MNDNSFACSPLGQVAQHMHATGERLSHEGMQRVADACLRRAYDPDDDVALLVRHVLLQYAHINRIDVMSLPQLPAH